MTDHNPHESTITTQDILEELDHAIGDHITWLKEWHGTLVCGEAPSAKALADDPHHLCRFGAWYVRNQHTGLVDQPALRNLATLHRKMHDAARALLEKALDGRPPDRARYDAFMDSAGAFISQARRLEKAFAAASSDLDPLTGLHNRQAMMGELESERERFLRSGRPSCVAIGDLDHFKRINDRYGHAAGDRVLIASAECFLGQLRPYDSVYRYGGEEFLFCLPDADMATAHSVLERLRTRLESHPIEIHGAETLSVTGSFGVAEMTPEATIGQTIEYADQALYRAKNGGRNRVCRWQPAGTPAARQGTD